MGAARTHGPPGPVELPGVDRLSCRPAFQQTVCTARATTTWSGMGSAELTCPLYAATLSDPRRERRLFSGHGGLLPAASLRPCPRSNGSEGNGIGNARGVPPRGARRRHLCGCKGACTSSRGRTPWQRHNQRHIPDARPARGCQSWTLCPRVRRHVPLACSGLACWETAEARAPRAV